MFIEKHNILKQNLPLEVKIKKQREQLDVRRWLVKGVDKSGLEIRRVKKTALVLMWTEWWIKISVSVSVFMAFAKQKLKISVYSIQ